MRANGTLGPRISVGVPNAAGVEKWPLEPGIDVEAFNQVVVGCDNGTGQTILLALQTRKGASVRTYRLDANGVPRLRAADIAHKLSSDVTAYDLAVPVWLPTRLDGTGSFNFLLALHNSSSGATRLYDQTNGQVRRLSNTVWTSRTPSEVAGFTAITTFDYATTVSIPLLVSDSDAVVQADPVIRTPRIMLYNRWSGDQEMWGLRDYDYLVSEANAGRNPNPLTTLIQRNVWTTGWTSVIGNVNSDSSTSMFLLKSGRWTNVEA